MKASALKEIQERAAAESQRKADEEKLLQIRKQKEREENRGFLADFFSSACEARMNGLWEVTTKLPPGLASALTQLGFIFQDSLGAYNNPDSASVRINEYFLQKASLVEPLVLIVADAMGRAGHRQQANRLEKAAIEGNLLGGDVSPGSAYMRMFHVLRTAGDSGNLSQLSGAQMAPFRTHIKTALDAASLDSIPLMAAQIVWDRHWYPSKLPLKIRNRLKEIAAARAIAAGSRQSKFLSEAKHRKTIGNKGLERAENLSDCALVHLGIGVPLVEQGFPDAELDKFTNMRTSEWLVLHNQNFCLLTDERSAFLGILRAMRIAAEQGLTGCIFTSERAPYSSKRICSAHTLDGRKLKASFAAGGSWKDFGAVLRWLGYTVHLRRGADFPERFTVSWS